MRKSAAVVLVLLGLSAACSSAKTPTAPAAGGLNLTGTWVTPIMVEDATARMTWVLTQVNDVVTGPVTVVLPSGIVLLNGFLTGTLTASSLVYTVSVGAGGVPTRPTCAGQLAGTLNVTIGDTALLSGPMTVSSSNCPPPFASSTITLVRQ